MTEASSSVKPRRRWSRFILPALLLGALTSGYLARGWWMPVIATFLDVSEPPRQVDCVQVLGGGADSRPFVAAALVRAGLAKRVLVPTVREPLDNLDGAMPPENELFRRVLAAREVAVESVVNLPGVCDSTLDEARGLAAYLETEPNATVAVVTNAFHTRRARLLFRRVLGPKMKQIHFVAAPDDHFEPESWWRTEEGFVTYVNEYCKLLLYTVH